MKVFPVVERELRSASRRRGTYWTRFGAATVAIVSAGWVLLMNRETAQTADLGVTIFGVLSWVALIYCLLAGVVNTADCISEEKREGTLGLLFLTDLKGYEVLFGKLAATSMNATYGLVAIFPVLALPLLLGGMTLTHFGTMLLVLLNALFLSLAVGICVSTFVEGERAATSWTLGILAFFTFGWWLAGWLVFDKLLGFGPFDDSFVEMAFWWVSPAFSLFKLLDSINQPAIHDGVWASLSIVHTIGWLLILIAQARLPRIWQDRVDTVRGLKWKQLWKQWSHGNSGQRLRYRSRMLDESPTLWLGSRNRLKPMMVWGLMGVMGIFWLWGLVENPEDWLDEGVYVVTGLILTTMLKVWVSVEAAHRFNHDRQSGALELLLSTPMQVPEIVSGQFQALKRQFLWPTIVVLFIHFLFILSEKASGGMVTWWLGAMAMLVADLFAISYVGMWLGLRHRYATRASGSTLARILILPGLLIIAFFTFVALASKFMSWGRFDNLLITVWLLAGLGVNLFFGLRAWQGLHDQLRDLAASRFDSGGRPKG